MPDLPHYRRLADKALSDRDHAARSVAEELQHLKKAKRLLRHAQEAQEIIQRVAADVQTQAHEQIASVVNHCLRSVFGKDSLGFRIAFDRKRGKTEAKLWFVKGDRDVDPLTQAGGEVDVAAFALRLSCLLLMPVWKVVILDEPWRHINGKEYRERAADLLVRLSKELNIQIILSTGHDWLKVGKVIEVGGKDDNPKSDRKNRAGRI